MPNDEFLGDTSGDGSSSFDADKWYTQSRDRKGFSSTARMKIPPSILSQAGMLVARRDVPQLKTTADVLRHALVVGLHYTAEKVNDPAFSAAVNAFTHIADMEARANMYEADEQSVKLLEDAVTGATRGREPEDIEWCRRKGEALRLSVSSRYVNDVQRILDRLP